jgi:hypothetical protein
MSPGAMRALRARDAKVAVCVRWFRACLGASWTQSLNQPHFPCQLGFADWSPRNGRTRETQYAHNFVLNNNLTRVFETSRISIESKTWLTKDFYYFQRITWSLTASSWEPRAVEK